MIACVIDCGTECPQTVEGNFLFLDMASSIKSPKPVLFLASASESEMNLPTEAALDLLGVSHVLFVDVELPYVASNLQ